MARQRIAKNAGEWLVQFVSDRARKFSDGRQPRSFRKLVTRVAKVVFRTFPIIDVDREAIPLNDLSAEITLRFPFNLLPSVLSVSTSNAAYYVV